ncbi:hypothetical protein EON80_27180 [bacterium]|nr:MAG: hypothetical protein EON80_27180 [bacterium]
MFDIQAIPGEAECSIDWAKLQHDLVEDRHPNPVSVMGAPLYPIFEIAVWELAALQQLLMALDERYTALEKSVLTQGRENQHARQQLQKAEGELMVARTEFLEAFHRLNSQYGKEIAAKAERAESDEEKRVLEAINALWDMEAVWSSHRALHPGRKMKVPEA